jgi:hypothetical protein
VAHKKNLFVMGVGGMQDLPGQLVVDSGCSGYFGNGRASIFVGAPLLLRGIEVSVSSGRASFRD